MTTKYATPPTIDANNPVAPYTVVTDDSGSVVGRVKSISKDGSALVVYVTPTEDGGNAVSERAIYPRGWSVNGHSFPYQWDRIYEEGVNRLRKARPLLSDVALECVYGIKRFKDVLR